MLKPRRVPGDVVVHHEPTELEIDALTGRVGGYEQAGTVRAPETLHLLFPRRPVQTAVDLPDVTREAESFQPSHEIVGRVAVFGEDEPLLIRMTRVFQYFAQLLELRFVAGFEQAARPGTQACKRIDLGLQLVDRDDHKRTEHRVLVVLVSLSRAIVARVVVGAVRVEVVLAMLAVQPLLAAAQVERR